MDKKEKKNTKNVHNKFMHIKAFLLYYISGAWHMM